MGYHLDSINVNDMVIFRTLLAKNAATVAAGVAKIQLSSDELE
jgi:hypothetical protein